MTFAEQLLLQLSGDVQHIFSVPGRTVFPFLKNSRQFAINDIICASETGAGFMAEGYAKASNKYGVAITVAGPGFSNVFPSITNAYYDNTKVLFIIGTGETYHSGKNLFQDNSLVQLNSHNLFASLTSYSCMINSLDYANHYANMMFNLKHKSLPVLMNVPLDVQNMPIDYELPTIKSINDNSFNRDAFVQLKSILQQHNVLIVTGNRAVSAKRVINQLVTKYFLLSASTLCAKGTIDELLPNYLGIFGFGMSPRVFELMMSEHQPEYIITIGMDINERNTYQWSQFEQNIIHLDEALHQNSRDYYLVNNGYIGNLELLFNELLHDHELEQSLLGSILLRRSYVNQLKESQIITTCHEDDDLYVDDVLANINKIYADNTNYVTDSGLHRLYCAQILRLAHGSNYYSSVNNGHMGWAIAASIGVKLADKQRNCICITGDGCMLMTGMEIQTAAKYQVKVLFIVINNGAHGAIKNANRQYPQLGLVDHQYDIPSHDWGLFANSLGVPSLKIKTTSQLLAALEMFRYSNEPLLLDVHCDYDSKVNINRYYEMFVQSRKQLAA